MAGRFLKIAAFCLGVARSLGNMVRNIGSSRKGKAQLARPPSLHISEWK